MKSLIGKFAVAYASAMPNHRGRHRALSILDQMMGPFALNTPSGPALEVYLSSPMDLSYFSKNNGNDHIDHIVPKLIDDLKPGECFIDVGANIGWLSNLASKKVGTEGLVVSFEPSPREYERFLRGMLLNNSNNIIPVNCALGGSQSLARLELAETHTGLNRLQKETTAAPTGWSTVAVPVWRGDDILPTLVGSRPVALIKIDTEGAEYMVLSGMTAFIKKYRPAKIAVEITPRFLERFGASKGDIYKLLAELSYQPSLFCEEDQYDEVFCRCE